MEVDGLWAAEFFTKQGDSGSGVVVFNQGRLLGGDASYYYSGRYRLYDATLTADVVVKHYHGDLSNIFGPIPIMRLVLQAAVGDPWIMGHGFDPTVPDRRLSLRLRRLEKL